MTRAEQADKDHAEWIAKYPRYAQITIKLGLRPGQDKADWDKLCDLMEAMHKLCNGYSSSNAGIEVRDNATGELVEG